MKIVIVGIGEVGLYLTKILSKEKHDLTLIDINKDKLSAAKEILEVRTIEGHGSSMKVLKDAGCNEADIVLAVTNNDETNMLVSIMSKALGAKKTIVRKKRSEIWGGSRHFYRKNIRADFVLYSDELVSIEIQNVIRQHKGIDIESFADGRILIRDRIIGSKSPFAAKTVSALALPQSTLISLIIRAEKFIIPRGDTRIEENDHVLFLGSPKGIEELEKLDAGTISREIKKAVIVGGSDIGLYLARALERSHIQIKLIEANMERAKHLSTVLTGSTIIHGDGTNMDLLKSERIDDCDVFISVCKEDEINLMSCQLAKEIGVPKLIALTNKADYAPIYKRLGIDTPISPRILMAQAILQFINSGSFLRLSIIEEGLVEILEMEVLPRAKVCKKKMADIGFPKNAMVAAVLRNGDMVIPRGQFTLEAGDILIVFTLVSDIPALEKLFRSPKDQH